MAGRVVVLNGTSSAGKSTLAAALQARLVARGECWAVIALDDALAKVPLRWVQARDAHVGDLAAEGFALVPTGPDTLEHRIGPVGRAFLAGYRGWVGATARAGVSVIVDEVLLTEEEHEGWLRDLSGLDVRWVRVSCPLEVAVAREVARGDRMRGLAADQHDRVHRWPAYTVEVDTSVLAPDAAAEVVLAAVLDPR